MSDFNIYSWNKLSFENKEKALGMITKNISNLHVGAKGFIKNDLNKSNILNDLFCIVSDGKIFGVLNVESINYKSKKHLQFRYLVVPNSNEKKYFIKQNGYSPSEELIRKGLKWGIKNNCETFSFSKPISKDALNFVKKRVKNLNRSRLLLTYLRLNKLKSKTKINIAKAKKILMK